MRATALAALLTALCATFGWQLALAQDGTAALQVTIAPDGPVTVGDLVEIQIRVEHDAGDRVEEPQGIVQLGGMEPSAAAVSSISETVTMISYRTRSFAVGSFELVMPDVAITSADGSVRRFSPPPVAVDVQSVLSDPAEPRPLTPPDLLEGDARTFAPWIVAIIGIGVGFMLARAARRWRRPAPESTAAEQADTPSSASPAFDMDASLPSAEQCRRLAAAVRARLADDWPLPASALTAAEIGPALARAGAPSAVVLRVTQLLEACDRVQYGGEEPTAERLSGYAQLAAAIWSEAAHEGR